MGQIIRQILLFSLFSFYNGVSRGSSIVMSGCNMSDIIICFFVEDVIYRKKWCFVLVIDMASTEFPRLYAEKNISALHNFMKNLDETENITLTKRQTTTLKKAVEGIITSITTEKSKNSQSKSAKLISRLRPPIMTQCQNSGRASEGRRLWRAAE